jgi:hypothetical protein
MVTGISYFSIGVASHFLTGKTRNMIAGNPEHLLLLLNAISTPE